MVGNTFVTTRGDRISLAFGRRLTVGRTGNGPYPRVDEVSDGGAHWRPLLNLSKIVREAVLQRFGHVMDMVIFRTIFFELLVFFTFTLLTFHFAC